MQADREARIRERAYQIWVAEGRAHGSEEAHWHRAEREIAAAEARPAARRARPRATAGGAGNASKSRAQSASADDGQKPDTPARRSRKAAVTKPSG
jgi:hypothetical protein